MKAVVMERYGAPDVLKLRNVKQPASKARECLVRVHAASIKFAVAGFGSPTFNLQPGVVAE